MRGSIRSGWPSADADGSDVWLVTCDEWRAEGRDTRPACPLFRGRTSGPLVPTLRGKVADLFGVGMRWGSGRRSGGMKEET